jgi:ribosome biogenesis GTPase A
LDSEDFLNLLNGLADKKGIVVNVVDVFDFEGSFITIQAYILHFVVIF